MLWQTASHIIQFVDFLLIFFFDCFHSFWFVYLVANVNLPSNKQSSLHDKLDLKFAFRYATFGVLVSIWMVFIWRGCACKTNFLIEFVVIFFLIRVIKSEKF